MYLYIYIYICILFILITPPHTCRYSLLDGGQWLQGLVPSTPSPSPGHAFLFFFFIAVWVLQHSLPQVGDVHRTGSSGSTVLYDVPLTVPSDKCAKPMARHVNKVDRSPGRETENITDNNNSTAASCVNFCLILMSPSNNSRAASRPLYYTVVQAPGA